MIAMCQLLKTRTTTCKCDILRDMLTFLNACLRYENACLRYYVHTALVQLYLGYDILVNVVFMM